MSWSEHCNEAGCDVSAIYHDIDNHWCGDHLIANSEEHAPTVRLTDLITCLYGDCIAPSRTQDGITVLCLEHYISGGGPLHDAYADWVREQPDRHMLSVTREAFEAGWDARGTLKVEG